MMTVRKALLATAVAAALSPAAMAAETTLFGNLDASVEYTNNADKTNNNAGSIESYDSEIGVEGSIELDNGNTAGYHVRWDIGGVDENTGGLTADEIYISLGGDWGTVRVGQQNTGSYHAVQQADLFADTVADIANVLDSDGATTGDTINYLGGDEDISYSAAVQFVDENENDVFAMDVMASFKISEDSRVNVAYADREGSSASRLTVAGQFGGFHSVVEFEPDGNGTDDNIDLTLGYEHAMSDTLSAKAQLGLNDLGDNNDNDADPMNITIGVDKKLADSVTTYALLNVADDDTGGNGETTTIAGGIKLSF